MNLCDVQTQISLSRRRQPPADSSEDTSDDVGGVESSAADLEISSISPPTGAGSSSQATPRAGKPPMVPSQPSTATTVLAAQAPSARILRSSALPSDPVPMAPPPPPEDYPPSPSPLPIVFPNIEYVFTGSPAPSPLSLLALRAFHRSVCSPDLVWPSWRSP